MFINPDTAVPKISPTQALVKVKAFGLNRMDLLQREGLYPLPPQAPETMGVEFSGTIEELGAGGEREFKKGDEVFGLAYGGAYAEYIAVSTHMLVKKPQELSWEEAAGIPEVSVLLLLLLLLSSLFFNSSGKPKANFFDPLKTKTWITATQAMYLIGHFKPGKSILWHAGASSVSISGIQLSLGDGASAVYATARSDEKTDFCTSKLGATAAFNSTKTDWADEVLKATDGKGVDIIVDFIGPEAFAANLRAIAKDGIIVNLATLSGPKLKPEFEQPDMTLFFRKRARFEGSGLRSRDEEYQGRLRDQLVEHALPKFKDGSFKVFVEKVFPWEKIQEAHGQMARNETKGKLICTIS